MAIILKEEFYSAVSQNVCDSVCCSFQFAKKIGINIFLIGGIVRDLILKKPVKDIDIAVQGDAIEFSELLKKECDCEIIAIQEKLRTTKVKFQNGVVIDFASTREEKYIQSGVLPEAYNFGCELEKDVRRRDFTINTLALNSDFELVDYYDGYSDIQNKKIRILHKNSFIDDPSRIIRALKFSERFDFVIENETLCLMQNYLEEVNSSMPLERIKGELKQYFEIDKKGLYERFVSSNAYKLISDNPVKKYDEDRLNELLDYDLFVKEERWFIDIIMLILNSDYAIDRLNLNSCEKKILKESREVMKKPCLKDKVAVYNLFNEMNGISIAIYYVLTLNPMVKTFLEVLRDVKLLITGKDLIELGLLPSPYFNKIFNAVLKEKLDGKLKTKEEELKFLQKYIGKR